MFCSATSRRKRRACAVTQYRFGAEVYERRSLRERRIEQLRNKDSQFTPIGAIISDLRPLRCSADNRQTALTFPVAALESSQRHKRSIALDVDPYKLGRCVLVDEPSEACGTNGDRLGMGLTSVAFSRLKELLTE